MVEILQTLNDENLSCKLLIILKLFILQLFHVCIRKQGFSIFGLLPL